jgi:ribosomal protein S18 acetylase RimI-like enzyme
LVLIREYLQEDRDSIIDVCWKTGYMGEPVKKYFNDAYLFGLLFCIYYIDYEPENCFVAVDETENLVVGYILSSFDSETQQKKFRKKMLSKICRRVFFYTIWRYHKSFKAIRYMQKMFEKAPENENKEKINIEYPAHLHIDILDQYQRQGIGSKLLEKLETHLKKNLIIGVHLGTSNKNVKAIPFYNKMGFSQIYEGPPGYNMWKEEPEVRSLIFAKKMK